MNLLREATRRYRRRKDFWRRLSALLELATPVYRPIDLAQALGRGLPLAALDALVREGYLRPGEVSFVAPQRTLTHRRARGARLRPGESERLARIAKAVLYAEQVFRDKALALKWLRAPKRRLGGRTPFELLATGESAQVVDEELTAIDEGYLA